MLGFLYADDLILCGELEEDLRVIVESFVELCWRRVLKVSAHKSKVMVLNGEEGFECKFCVGGMRLEHVSNVGDLLTM